MRRIIAIVLAGVFGFTAPVLAQTGNASAGGQNTGQLPSQSSSDGNSAMAQDQDQEGGFTPSPLLIGGVVVGVGVLVVVLATHKSSSP